MVQPQLGLATVGAAPYRYTIVGSTPSKVHFDTDRTAAAVFSSLIQVR